MDAGLARNEWVRAYGYSDVLITPATVNHLLRRCLEGPGTIGIHVICTPSAAGWVGRSGNLETGPPAQPIGRMAGAGDMAGRSCFVAVCGNHDADPPIRNWCTPAGHLNNDQDDTSWICQAGTGVHIEAGRGIEPLIHPSCPHTWSQEVSLTIRRPAINDG